ncbi:hypothetical protein RB597_002715 [Gaeumannomyces tritici]
MPDRVLMTSLLGIYDNSKEAPQLFADVRTARAAIVVSTVISTLAILFRLYTRLVIVKKVGWDDMLLGIYMIFGVAQSILVFELTKRGWGMHIMKMKLMTVMGFRHMFYYASGVYVVATTIIKLSLLFQYLRIPNLGKLHYRLLVATTVVVSVWGIGFSAMVWYPCSQVSQFWSSLGSDKCWFFGSLYIDEVLAAYLSHSASNMVLDFAVLALAAPLFWKKDTSAQAKHGLLALVIMGAFVTGLAIWRMQSLMQNKAGSWPTLDPFFYTATPIVLSVLEINCASVVASVPVFWPVLLRHISRISRILVIQVTAEVRVESRNRESLLEDMAAGHPSGGGGGGDGQWLFSGGYGPWARLDGGGGGGGEEVAKLWPTQPIPAMTRTAVTTGGASGHHHHQHHHRGVRNDSNGGNSVELHEINMPKVQTPGSLTSLDLSCSGQSASSLIRPQLRVEDPNWYPRRKTSRHMAFDIHHERV